MALQIWLPLNGDLHNQGLSNLTITNNGATIDDNGKIGKCYSFNSNYIKITDLSIPINTWSLTVWAYPQADTSSGHQYIVGINTSSASDFLGVLCFYQNKFGIRTAGTTYSSPNTSALNHWYHICATYDGTDLKLYVNGILVLTKNSPAAPKAASTCYIGTRGGITGNFHGKINDVRIYDHCLSDKEVEEISKGLVLHYQLNNGNPNLLSEYVTPGQGAPGVTSTGGRTNYYGKYGIIIPATENADTYFRLFLKQQLVQGNTYTISCYVSGLLPGSSYNFPLFAQGNTSMGILQLNHNGLCSLTFTMNSSSQSAVTTPEGDTVYVCFMDDSGRTLTSGQGTIIVNGFKLEQGNNVTSFLSMDNDIIYDSSGYNNNGTIVGEITTNNSSPKYNNNIKQTNGQYIRVNNQPTVCMPKDAITVNLWQYATSWSNPISCTEGGGWNFENSNGIRFPVYISGVGYKVAQSTITPASTLNAWHMLTGTMDKDNIKIYYDGEEVGTVTNGSTNGIGYANNYIFIGAEAQGNNTVPAGSGYAGGISDVRIYATALTPVQIKELYKISKIVDGIMIKARDLEVSA